MRKIFRFLIIGSFFLAPIVASALSYTLLEPIPGFLPTRASGTLEEYLVGMFRLIIGVAGILAVIRIMWCGLNLMMSVNPSAKEEAKECIKLAIFGLLLALGAFMIINTVSAGAGSQGGFNIPRIPGAIGAPQVPSGTPVCTISAANTNLFEGQVTNLFADCTPRATNFLWQGSGGAPAISGQGNFITFPTPGTYTYIVQASNALGTGAQSQAITITVSPRAAPACSQDMPQEVVGPITCAQSNSTLNWSALGTGEREEAVVLGNGQSLSVQFTTAGGGAYGSFTTRAITTASTISVNVSTSSNTTQDLSVSQPTNLNPIKYANISRASCDFRYENLSRSLCAISGSDITLDFQVGAGNPPNGARPGCVLEPNTAYVINIRNENASANTGNRAVDTCPISGICEFTARLTQSQASQFTPRVVQACTPTQVAENPGPTLDILSPSNNSTISSESTTVTYSVNDPIALDLVQFTVYNLDTGAIIDSETVCTGTGTSFTQEILDLFGGSAPSSIPACGGAQSGSVDLRVGQGQGSYRIEARACSRSGACTIRNTIVVVEQSCIGGSGLTCFDLPNGPVTSGDMCVPAYGFANTLADSQVHGYRFRLAPGEYARLVIANRPRNSCTAPINPNPPTYTPPPATPVTPRPTTSFTPPAYPALPAGMTEVRPTETTDLLHNPGIGIVDFGSSLDESQQPRATVSYLRWYWDFFEPQEGQYNWAGTFDRAIADARARGQTLDWRIMPNAPSWMIAQGVAAMPIPGGGDGENNIPDHNNPVFIAAVERALRAISERYGDSPDINMMDFSFVGRWGEWHTWVDESWDVQRARSYYPTADTARRIIDWHYQYFPNTPKSQLVGYFQAFDDMAGVLPRGAGWRGDCYGDLLYHHPSVYRGIASGIANTAWQYGPVSMETCGVMSDWPGWTVQSEADFDLILQEALDWHASTINNKSTPIPPQWRAKVDEWLKYIGYRFALNFIQHTSSVSAGGQLQMNTYWINRGNAPAYHRYPIAYRLRSGSGSVVAEWQSTQDIRLWLPGFHQLNDSFTVPGGISSGAYSLDVAILDRYPGRPPLELAMPNRGADGWYNVSTVTVR